jgi:hypothetical protein
MANFGWAYVNCIDEDGAGQAAGPTGSIQFLTGVNSTNGVAALIYHTSSASGYSPSTMILSGNLIVTGAVSASIFHYQNVTVIDATGSTHFGDTDDDVHMRTGSFVAGSRNSFGNFPAISSSTETNQVWLASTRYRYKQASTTPYTIALGTRMYGVTRTSATEIRLVSASIAGSGHTIVIKDEVLSRTGAGNNITITGSPGSDILIDGSGEYILTGTMPAISLYSNGTNWFVF